jgi:hypothetical protein
VKLTCPACFGRNRALGESYAGYREEEAEVPIACTVDREASSLKRRSKPLTCIPALVMVHSIVVRPEERERRDAYEELAARLEDSKPVS